MISRIALKGVKSFKEETTIRFAPLTVLTGTNSSGKSSVFQALLALKQTFELPPQRFAGLYLNGKYVSLGSYADWSSDHKGNPITLSISLTRSPRYPEETPALVGTYEQYGARAPGSHTKPWWMPTWRTSWTSLRTADVTADFILRLKPADEATNVAQLTSLLVSSTLSVDAEQNKYNFEVVEVERGPEYDSTFSAPDLAQSFPFCVHETTQSRSQSPTAKTLPCAVQGLHVASVLRKTNRPAINDTIARLLQMCMAALRNTHACTAPGPASSKRWNPSRHMPSGDSTRTQLERNIAFVEKADASIFLDNVAQNTPLAMLLVSWRVQHSSSRYTNPMLLLRSKLAHAYLTRLQQLAEQLLPVLPGVTSAAEQADEIERESNVPGGSLNAAFSLLNEQCPEFREILTLASTMMRCPQQNGRFIWLLPSCGIRQPHEIFQKPLGSMSTRQAPC